MHGRFHQHQHYMPRPTQGTSSASLQRSNDLTQLGQLNYPAQHAAGLTNGQAYERHGGQHLQQQRIHQIPHPSEYTQQHYTQLLQNQVLYTQALQHQQQQQHSSTAARQHQEQQRIYQQQQNDQTLLSLLSNPTLQQHVQMSQLRLGQSPLLGVPSSDCLQTPKPTGRYSEESISSRAEQQDQDAGISRNRPQPRLQSPNMRNIPQNQNLLSPEMLMARHLSPSAGPSPPGYHHPQNASYLMISPTANHSGHSGMISPRQTGYSPAHGHIAGVTPNRPHTAHPSRAELGLHEQYPGYPTMVRRSTSQDLQSPRLTTPTGPNSGVTKTNVHVKRQTPSVNSTSTPVIVLDSDDDEESFVQEEQKQRQSNKESSLKSDRVIIDGDLEITGIREAEIMSHMRPDCPIYQFERADTVSSMPLKKNASRCKKCYCYICDCLAEKCSFWESSERPHCNAHPKASCWKARRSVKKSPLMLSLPNDKITPEMTESGEIALQFMIRIRECYITYRTGVPCDFHQVPCDCPCHRNVRGAREEACMSCKSIHDAKKRYNYAPVREIALKIVQEIRAKYCRDRPITALIALEAVLSELSSQRPADFNHATRRQSNPDPHCQCNFPAIIDEHIEKDMVTLLTRFEVPQFFLEALKKSVDEAIKPLQLEKVMKRFTSMKHWDDILLRAVLSGSNVTGSKGREHLRETPEVIRHRVEKMTRETKHLAILRYLKAVKILQTTKDNEIFLEIERWKLLHSAHLGRFKEVIVKMMDLIPRNNSQNGNVHLAFPMTFIFELLDALTNEDPTRNVRIDSFSASNGKILGRDADAIVLLILLILHQKQLPVGNMIMLALRLARWVNRNTLPKSLDPMNTRRWLDEGTQLIGFANQSMQYGNAQTLLAALSDRDPRVHLLIASMCIINIASRHPESFQAEHRLEILDIYKNNDWALFLLVTQAHMMSFRDPNILRWVAKFCDENNGSISQIQDSVITEAIKSYPLDVLSEFLSALIKPEWISSTEPIRRTVIQALSEFSTRLFRELPQIPRHILLSKARWVEENSIKPFLEQKLFVPHDSQQPFKNIIKKSCFLNPVKRNVELSQRFSGSDWPQHCDKLIRLLMDKFKKVEKNPETGDERMIVDGNYFSGTMEEFSLLLWLFWISHRSDDFAPFLSYFQDNHSCDADETKVSSSKMPDEIARLLDSANVQNLFQMKLNLLASSQRLCVVETLSWLTCTVCATKMPNHWTKVWISAAKCGDTSRLHSLISAMLKQFKEWLNKISLDVPESYHRLLKCLRSFLCTLVTTWQHCAIPLEEMKKLLIDVAQVVNDPNFRRDLAQMGTEIVDVEMAKLRPKFTPAPVPRAEPPRPTIPAQLPPQQTPSSPKRVAPPQSAKPEPPKRKPSREQQNTPQRPDNVDLPKKRTPIPSSLTTLKQNGSPKDSPLPQPSRSQVLSNEPQVTPKSTPKDDGEPFSPLNLSRTKPCPNCKFMISCASYRCPKCNKPTRSKQPVICPGCHQENLEVKKYSCEFCYRSLIDVMFVGNTATESKVADIKAKKDTPQESQKIKKKVPEKRRKKSKNDEFRTTETIVTTQEVITLPSASRNPAPKQKPPPKVATNLQEAENSGSSSDDFVAEPPKKQPKLISRAKPPHPKPIKAPVYTPIAPMKISGASLTESESESSGDDSLDHPPKEVTPQIRPPPQDYASLSYNKASLPVKKDTPLSQRNQIHSTMKPRFPPKPDEHVQRPQPVKLPVQPTSTSGLKKRGVGHSSAMSKNQKKLLSRLGKNWKGTPKFASTQKNHPVNKPKETAKAPAPAKPPQETTSVSFAGNHLAPNDRSNFEGNHHSNAMASPSSLSFSLAKVRPRNIGHRTGGAPVHHKKVVNAAAKETAREFLFPKALNDHGALDKKLKKTKSKEVLKRPRMKLKIHFEKRLDTLLSKRIPGPASRSNYRKIAKLDRKLKKLCRPSKLWEIPSKIILPPDSDLSLYMVVSLSPFPSDKLRRIQSLVPRWQLKNLFA